MYIKVNMLIRINPVLVVITKYGDGRRKKRVFLHFVRRFGKQGLARMAKLDAQGPNHKAFLSPCLN